MARPRKAALTDNEITFVVNHWQPGIRGHGIRFATKRLNERRTEHVVGGDRLKELVVSTRVVERALLERGITASVAKRMRAQKGDPASHNEAPGEIRQTEHQTPAIGDDA